MGLLSACGGAATSTSTREAHELQQAPSAPSLQVQLLRDFAERAFQVLQDGAPTDLVFDDVTLRRLLHSVAATRASAQRNGMFSASDGRVRGFELWRGARFGGACFQGLRDEAVGTLFGLAEPGWVFERVLLVGQEPTGRIAVWLEGEFVLTDAGFGAIVIQAVETPRRNHSDLELAVCDVDLGVHEPLDVVVEDAFNH